jgi:hypothetical protein
VKLQHGLEGCSARILVRLHSNRVFYAEPDLSFPRPVGRPPRHGKKFDLKDSASRPEPSAEYRCDSEDYGSVRVRCWSGLHPKTRRIGERYRCERAPIVRGTVVLVEVGKLPRQRPASPRRSCGCGGAGRAMQISTSSGRHTAAGSISTMTHPQCLRKRWDTYLLAASVALLLPVAIIVATSGGRCVRRAALVAALAARPPLRRPVRSTARNASGPGGPSASRA